MAKKKKIIGLFFGLAVLAAVLLIPGCGWGNEQPVPEQLEKKESGNGGETTEKAPDEVFVLFFTNTDNNMLIGEEREIPAKSGPDLKVALLQELIKGPQKPGLSITIPAGTKVLGVNEEKEKGLVTVNFSEEIITGHWGGSFGEIVTVYSVVNTLAQLPGVEQVRFLVEGDEVETLVGHLDISEPVEPDWGMVREQSDAG
ncbi:MAG: GerMN domain-containing protein [Firmicutes bacterium]|nr:GerMN domain-containing protein [Bacillota bacterium]